MARKITFDDAVKLLREMRRLPEEEFRDTDDLEKIVLRHIPRHWEEAAVILEEVGYNLEAGARGDGLDVRAVNRIGRWLRQLDVEWRLKTATESCVPQNAAA